MNEDDPGRKLERLHAVCEAIAHPARRQILLTVHLRGGEMTAGSIAGRFAHAWPTTTRHLQVLEQAGLLTAQKVGREKRYRLDPAALAPLSEWLAWFRVESIYARMGAGASETVTPTAGDPVEARTTEAPIETPTRRKRAR